MPTSKHPKTRKTDDRDLKVNPGIGASEGIEKPEDFEEIEGENTFEGDVKSDTTAAGGIDPDQVGRTNK